MTPVTITWTTQQERQITLDGKPSKLPKGTELSGVISARSSDGPMNQRPYQLPSFLTIRFNWEDDLKWEKDFPCQSLIGKESRLTTAADFREDCGPLQSVADSREDWHLRSDDESKVIPLKYAEFTVSLMFLSHQCVARCNIHNSAESSHTDFDYIIPYDEFLLTPDNEIYYREDRTVEDISWASSGNISVARVTTEDELKARLKRFQRRVATR